MYPSAFEFSSVYLVEILDCVISGRFGNFLGNNERERQKDEIADSCRCMWVYLKQLRSSSEKNKDHEHYNINSGLNKNLGALFPPEVTLATTLWSYFHLQWATPLEEQCRSKIEEKYFIEKKLET